ncbi:MAG: hypothetical protein Q8J64_08910 [Thermodesulfovibrionales bacterium]|nr:hypothetical protein [Thermodesulfovibrionales bacterium]
MEHDSVSKDILILKYTEEKKALISKLTRAIESEKQAYERLADLDITRHVEVADFKGEIDGLKSEIKRLRASEDLSIKAMEKLRREEEVGKLQLKESEDNLLKTAEALMELQSRQVELESSLKAADSKWEAESIRLKAALAGLSEENSSLKESLSHASSLLDKKQGAPSGQIRPEDSAEVDRLLNAVALKDEEINALKSELQGKESALMSKQEEMRSLDVRHKSEVERLSAGKEELGLRLAAAEGAAASLREEKAELTKRLSQIAAEMDRLRSERTEEISSMGANLGAVTEKITDDLANLQRGIADNLERLEHLSTKQMEYYPTVVMDEEKPERTTGRTLLTAGAVFLLLTAFGLFGLYAVKGRLPDRIDILSLVRKPAPLDAARIPKAQPQPLPAPPWTGTREVVQGDFTATLSYLTPDIMDSSGISAKLSGPEKDMYYIYSLELTAKEGFIPEEIVSSPLNAVSFIDAQGGLVRPADIPNLEGSKKAIYRIKSGSAGAALFRCYLAAAKTVRLKGASIKGLVKEAPIVIDSPLI